jgi:hypothetical protein
MILKIHLDEAGSYDVGDEIWHESLADVIRAEADMIASYGDARVVGAATRVELRDRIIFEMTAALVSAGDSYQAQDGVVYSLHHEPARATSDRADRLSGMSSELDEPVIDGVLRFENLPLAEGGSRRAIVRWSDGSESAAVTWYPDEILLSEGDLIGKTSGQIRSLHFRRDRDWLQS